MIKYIKLYINYKICYKLYIVYMEYIFREF